MLPFLVEHAKTDIHLRFRVKYYTCSKSEGKNVIIVQSAQLRALLFSKEQFLIMIVYLDSTKPPPPQGGGVLPYVCIWVCAARETPIFSPKFPLRSISITQITKKIRSGASPFYIFCGFCRSGDQASEELHNRFNSISEERVNISNITVKTWWKSVEK